jgi:hypothetical protein
MTPSPLGLKAGRSTAMPMGARWLFIMMGSILADPRLPARSVDDNAVQIDAIRHILSFIVLAIPDQLVRGRVLEFPAAHQAACCIKDFGHPEILDRTCLCYGQSILVAIPVGAEDVAVRTGRTCYFHLRELRCPP